MDDGDYGRKRRPFSLPATCRKQSTLVELGPAISFNSKNAAYSHLGFFAYLCAHPCSWGRCPLSITSVKSQATSSDVWCPDQGGFESSLRSLGMWVQYRARAPSSELDIEVLSLPLRQGWNPALYIMSWKIPALNRGEPPLAETTTGHFLPLATTCFVTKDKDATMQRFCTICAISQIIAYKLN